MLRSVVLSGAKRRTSTIISETLRFAQGDTPKVRKVSYLLTSADFSLICAVCRWIKAITRDHTLAWYFRLVFIVLSSWERRIRIHSPLIEHPNSGQTSDVRFNPTSCARLFFRSPPRSLSHGPTGRPGSSKQKIILWSVFVFLEYFLSDSPKAQAGHNLFCRPKSFSPNPVWNRGWIFETRE